jgi:c-di-GMP-binding flagellar brake protein YcgR
MNNNLYSGPERRKSPRKKAKFETEYIFWIDLSKKHTTFRIDRPDSVDISEGGLCVYSDIKNPIKIGEKVYLRLKLPEKTENIFALAQVAYIKQTGVGVGRKFRMGFKFLAIDEKDKKMIMNFVSEE